MTDEEAHESLEELELLEDDQEQEDRRRWLPWLILLLLVLLVWCLLWRFADLSKAPDQVDTPVTVVAMVTVPDVTGLTQAEAIMVLERAGFAAEVEPSFDAYAEPGTVAFQEPQGGSSAAKGSTVFLGVAEEIPTGGSLLGDDDDGVEVPGVTGRTQADAISRLEREGFSVRVRQAYSDSVPKGIVISQSPVAGERVGEGSVVTIVVSRGRAPVETVPVPQLTGLTKEAAESRIRAAGLEPRPMWQPMPSSVGKVYQQTPAPGARLPEEGLVFILIGVER